MHFIKMHGIGNDYVYLNGFAMPIADPAALAARLAPAMSDRHQGIGADGLIMVVPPDEQGAGAGALVRMRMFNADGSESEMCGNGVRCVCKLAFDHNVTPGIRDQNPMKVQTGNGVLSLGYELDDQGRVAMVSVDMGQPIVDLPRIPVDPARMDALLDVAHFVSMGNPHMVVFVDDVARVDVAGLGPKLEHHPAFPRRMNIHWVQVHSDHEVTMRTWERGSGITQACGTGASAVCVAGVRAGKTGERLLAHLPGGDLELHWDRQADRVTMTGPATEVFQGDWPNGG